MPIIYFDFLSVSSACGCFIVSKFIQNFDAIVATIDFMCVCRLSGPDAPSNAEIRYYSSISIKVSNESTQKLVHGQTSFIEEYERGRWIKSDRFMIYLNCWHSMKEKNL